MLIKLLELKVSMLSFNYQNQSSGDVLLQKQPPEVFCTDSVAQVFSCKFCEISKNTFFYRIPLVAASVCLNVCLHLRQNVSCVKFMKSIELDTKFAVSLILKSLLTSKNKIKAHLNWVNWNF